MRMRWSGSTVTAVAAVMLVAFAGWLGAAHATASERERASGPSQRLQVEPDDPLDVLWSHRIEFGAGGAPLVTIRLMEGQQEIAFRPSARARLRLRGAAAVDVAAGVTIRVHARDALPAVLAYHPLLADVPYADRATLDAVRRRWEARGVELRQQLTGAVYGIAGHVIDTRRLALLAATDGGETAARAFADRALALDGARTALFTELVRRPSGRLDVVDAAGRRIASADALASLDVEGGAPFTVARVEHDVGYAAHGFEDRVYHGRLNVTVDATGRLAAVLAVPLEELLRGLVPSEIPAGSPREALKAQAVTARSNVLAQIGTRHLTDPYVLCSEVHCQAYRGDAAQTPSTDAAVRSTDGEALFGADDHVLVDAVYSAVCGGHGEDNDAVWPTLPNRVLRGRPDLPAEVARRWSTGLTDEETLRSFLAGAPQAWCGRATGLRKDRYRWERRFTATDLDAIAQTLGIGRFRALEVTARGVSGRARSMVMTGDGGRSVVEGELRIRKLLGNLPSAMFVADPADGGIVLHGGGWGHGVGMCQWGAIGRAEGGQDYRTILRSYYGGAEVARIY